MDFEDDWVFLYVMECVPEWVILNVSCIVSLPVDERYCGRVGMNLNFGVRGRWFGARFRWWVNMWRSTWLSEPQFPYLQNTGKHPCLLEFSTYLNRETWINGCDGFDDDRKSSFNLASSYAGLTARGVHHCAHFLPLSPGFSLSGRLGVQRSSD